MTLELLTKLSDINKYVESEIKSGKKLIANGFCEIGIECSKIAKERPQGGTRAQYPTPYKYLGNTRPNYTDWTQNLRKSIGWAVLNDGDVYQVDLGPIGNTRLFFEEIKSNYSDGIILLVMATGSSPDKQTAYAGYVQALGYDVLKTSELQAPKVAKKIIKKLLIDVRSR